MPRRPQEYVCRTCGNVFLSSNPAPQYCSRPCRDQNPDRKQRYSLLFRQIPDRQCVVCGATFRPAQRTMNNGTPVECCSAACAHIKARKHQRDDITHCLICNRALTSRQISNQGRYCSRSCQGEGLRQRHEQPEYKAFMREHGARCAARGQQAPTRIELAMADALNVARVRYVYQFEYGNRYGIIGVADFAIPEAMVIIECDGEYWHGRPETQQRDHQKDAYLKACGYTVLRFSEREIKQDVEACVQVVLSYL